MDAQQPLDRRALTALGPAIRKELDQLLSAATKPAAALHSVFDKVCGHGRTREERQLFLSFAAPIARRIVFARAPQDALVCGTSATIGESRIYLDWLERYYPDGVRAVDMRYFAGLGIKECSRLLDSPEENVLKDLRNVKHALKIPMSATH